MLWWPAVRFRWSDKHLEEMKILRREARSPGGRCWEAAGVESVNVRGFYFNKNEVRYTNRNKKNFKKNYFKFVN